MTHDEILQGLYDNTLVGNAPEVRDLVNAGLEDSLDILTELKNVANPVPRTSASLARGQLLYDTYCIVCHGPAGHSDGTVVPKFVPPPDITQPTTQQRSDGYIYAMIKQGRGIMPKYGDKIRDATDRWDVVNYVRKLQGVLP